MNDHTTAPGAGLLVLLHGFEDDPNRLASLAPKLDPADGATPVLAPRGTHERASGPSWLGTDEPEPEMTHLAGVLDALDAQIEVECRRIGCHRGEVVVGGFSQGGAVAMALAMRRCDSRPVRGCFTIASFIWPPESVDYDFDRARQSEFLMVHGAEDAAVPVQQGRSTSRLLERLGIRVSYREHPHAGHTLEASYLTDVRTWLTSLMGA